jgi:hypothetical protein
MALVIDIKAKKKPPTFEQLDMRFAALRSWPRLLRRSILCQVACAMPEGIRRP